ncbi:hypothetical protein B0H11DRAFT_73398 [Mycena galericulata]|nr:hypothetical protein B0H11DRAFT_73398 [Mycena galericulata]
MDINSNPFRIEPQVHDEYYFFDDGDCTFIAEGVIFKLHRWMLCRDPDSMFRGMFSIPQAMGFDRDPIPLSDVSAEFRALCWVVYALPHEIYLQTTRDADIGRLIDAAKMCHKYTLPLFETWALRTLLIQCQPPLHHLDTCTPDVLDRIMGLANLCDDAELLRLIEMAWLSRVHTGELRCSDALAAGEKYGRRKIQGDVYYHLNRQLHSTLATSCALSPMYGLSDLDLTDRQLLRLLTGHVLLSNFWGRLRQNGLPYSPRCKMMKYMHDTACVPAYSNIRWPADTSDVLMGLKAARDSAGALPAPVPFGIATCVASHLDVLMNKFASGELTDYFLGSVHS